MERGPLSMYIDCSRTTLCLKSVLSTGKVIFLSGLVVCVCTMRVCVCVRVRVCVCVCVCVCVHHLRAGMVDEGAAEEPAQPPHCRLQPRERPDGAVCDHWQSGEPVQGTHTHTHMHTHAHTHTRAHTCTHERTHTHTHTHTHSSHTHSSHTHSSHTHSSNTHSSH